MKKSVTNRKLHLLFNGLGSGNIGDEAMFVAFADRYGLPSGTTVEVSDPSHPIIKTLPDRYTYTDWRDNDRNNQSAKASRAGLLVGNTPVMCEWGLDWPMRALSARLSFFHSEGIPVHAVGVGVDDVRDPEAREIFRSAFLPIASWTVRSPQCRSALLDLGVLPEKIVVAADLAWLFSPDIADRPWAEDFWKKRGIDLSRPLLGVNVVNERWADRPEVKRAIAWALDRLITETGMQVAFLCNETREGAYFDAGAAKDVIGMMNRESVLVPNFYFTPSQMIALLSACTITLSQRYHFTIFSILAETVPLSFSRGQKMTSLLSELEDIPVGTMETCDPEALTERIGEALTDRSGIRSRQKTTADRQKQRASAGFAFIDALKSQAGPSPRLANVSELNSARFKTFMEKLNGLAGAWGLRTFTDWSKVWEYPWLWFNGLNALDLSRIRVLDLGSELSPMPWFLASLGVSVTLVEQDAQWLPQWKRLAEETGFNVDWRIVEDERLPFPAGSFDAVTSFSVLEHQRNKHLAVDEVARVLKPGGIFAVSFDICEPDMGMTFPEWNGQALTMNEFELLVLENPAFVQEGRATDWNIGDCAEFIRWHKASALHHNYTVGAALLQKKDEASRETAPSAPLDIRECKNILLPRFDTFGDIVLLEGLIEALLDFLPEARITLLVREGYDQLAALFPERLIWKTTRIHPYKKPSDPEVIKSLLEELKKDSYDLLLTTTYNRTWPDDLLAAVLTSAWRVAIGDARPNAPNAAELWANFGSDPPEDRYDVWVPVEERSHETEKYQTIWNHLTGKSAPLALPRLSVPADETKKAQDFLDTAGLRAGQFVFCFPAGVSNVSLKAWPESNFSEVIAHLEKRYSLGVLVAGHESEKGIVDRVVMLAKEQGASPYVWLGKDGDIPLACALVAKSSFYFGNDTGLMHMAAVLNKPVIAIFGGGTWPRFTPCGEYAIALAGKIPCSGCGWICIFEETLCMDLITSEDVENAIDTIIKSTNAKSVINEILEIDRMTNLKFIEQTINKLKSTQADRAARLEVIRNLQSRLSECEADRAARLEVIHDLQNRIDESETDRAARLDVIVTLQAKLSAMEEEIKRSLLWRFKNAIKRKRRS